MYLEAVVALCLVLCHIAAGRQVNLTIQVGSLQNHRGQRGNKNSFPALRCRKEKQWSHLFCNRVLIVSQAVIRQNKPVFLPLHKSRQKDKSFEKEPQTHWTQCMMFRCVLIRSCASSQPLKKCNHTSADLSWKQAAHGNFWSTVHWLGPCPSLF